MKPHFLVAAPWPPARSEIANNVADTQLPALLKRASLTLVGVQDEIPDGSRLRGMPVLLPVDALRQQPHAPLIAHLGNQPVFSSAATHALERRPGFAVMHDLVMHHAFFDHCRNYKWEARYIDTLKRHYGKRGEQVAKAAWHDARVVHENAGRYPLFEPYLDSALGVVVHSRLAYETVADRDRWPVCRLSLPFPGPDPITREKRLAHRRAQAQALAEGGPLKLIVFGHLGPNRGLPMIIEAMAALRERRISLDIYGTVAYQDQIEAQIDQGGLRQAIRIHGHVSDQALDAALQEAHVAINLRSPTVGEASASQLRLYAAGLPSIVTRHGWYAEQPESVVHFVRAGHEVPGLLAALTGILRAPGQLPGLAAAAFDQLRAEHDPDDYAAGLVDFVERTKEPGLRLLLARRYTGRAAHINGSIGITPTNALVTAIDSLLPQ